MRRLGALVVVGLVLAGCSATSSSSSSEGQPRALPVAGGVLDGSTAMAVLPLGHLEDPSNPFYETFIQNGSGSWSLSTPEGTATNGGIVLASPARGAGAVLSYLNLRLAAGFDLVAGQQTGAGEVLPLLAPVPSSLSVDPLTGAVAVLTEQGEVLTASSLAGPFHQLLSERSLAASSSDQTCGLQRLTALSFTSDGALALGGQCSRAGSSGIFLSTSAAAPSFRALLEPGAGPSTVIRLDLGSGGQLLDGLVLSSGGRSSLRAVSVAAPSDSPSASWSRPVELLAGEQLRASAGAPLGAAGPTEIATLAGPSAVRVLALVATPSVAVQQGPALPLSTAAALLGADGRLTAIEVTGGGTVHLEVLDGAGWSASQVIRVEVPYGSSS